MTERLHRLIANPGDWELRTQVVKSYYEAHDFDNAVKILSQAPAIPNEERAVLFSATIFSRSNPAHSIQLLDHYASLKGTTVEIENLRNRLQKQNQPQRPAPIPAAPEPQGPRPVPPRSEALLSRNINVVPAAPEPASPEQPHEETPSVEKKQPKRKKKGLLPQPPERAPIPEEETEPVETSPPKHEELEQKETAPQAKELATEEPVENPPPKEEELDTPIADEADDASNLMILVSEGEAVQAADKEDDSRERLNAVIAAIAIHVVMLILFAFWAVSAPPRDPPQIIASSPPVEESEIDAATLERMKHKQTTPMTPVSPTLSANAFSDFALPDTLNIDVNIPMTAMFDSDALGVSMSGFSMGNTKGIPAGMRSRCTTSQRMIRLRQSGGDEKAEDAVVKGLIFLTSQQDKETGAFGEEYTAGMTGLALLAYLGHCETPESMKFGDAVVSAALYLMNTAQANNGRMTNGVDGPHEAYEHAIATYALCELYTMTKSNGRPIPRLSSILTKAVGIIVNAQTSGGGWSYGFIGEGLEDLSVSSWQIQALKAAYNTGERFSGIERALDLATKDFLPRIQDAVGAFKYNPLDPKGRDTLTGAALLSMQIWKGKGSTEYYKGFRHLTQLYLNPSPGDNYYSPYYNTQAFFMEGGDAWENYNSKFQPQLLKAQNDDGSWLGGGPRKDDRFMNTAWAILMLEVYYRYLPTTDKADMRK